MEILRPIKTNLITQTFGDNRLPIYIESGMLGHNGIDFSAKHNEPIYWPCADIEGEVYQTYIDSAGGIGIDIIAKDKNGKIYKLRFWHLIENGWLPKIGTKVSTGDLIGFADNTGRSTGDHLHFGVKPQIIDGQGNYKNENPTNGYTGAIDPAPFFSNVYVINHMISLIKTQMGIIRMIIYYIQKIQEQISKGQ